MTGSTHYQIYEHNLRRILLLDWLRDEQVRRRLALDGARQALASGRPAEQPYWLTMAEATGGAAG